MFTLYSAIDYLCIDIANCYGLDKDLFEDRIQWVKNNVNQLESLVEDADDKYQYIKAVHALREVIKGNATGHTVGLDAICSGISLMSAMTGCIKGCKATGLIDTGKRPDAYTQVTEEMNKLLQKQGYGTVLIPRKDAKAAMMTRGYGSSNKPEEIFGKKTPELYAFQDACNIVAPEAFKLMQAMIDAWQKNALKHSWYMPDGFAVQLKTVETIEKTLRIDELEDLAITVYVKENVGLEKSVALAAHLAHSVDAYVLRTMQRKCSYDKKLVTKTLSLITSHLITPMEEFEDMPEKLEELLALYDVTNLVDVNIINYITETTIGHIPTAFLKRLNPVLEQMLHWGSFDVLTVHDCFRAHPNHCNAVRYWYKEICADLADSNILQAIYSQIVGYDVQFTKAMQGIGSLIRKANYQLS